MYIVTNNVCWRRVRKHCFEPCHNQMLRARETPQSIIISLWSAVQCCQLDGGRCCPASCSPVPAGGPSPGSGCSWSTPARCPPVVSLLLPGAACAAPDAGLGEINERALWLSSSASFACLAGLSFLSLKLPGSAQLPICTCPKPCVLPYPRHGLHPAGMVCCLNLPFLFSYSDITKTFYAYFFTLNIFGLVKILPLSDKTPGVCLVEEGLSVFQ